jgi:hypothetical protein
MRLIARSLSLLGFLLLLPTVAHTQTTLAGMVRDSSGLILPGVTVEAASPALIEKVRNAVTDTSGQYRIADLPPGTYSVTYGLTGFSRVKDWCCRAPAWSASTSSCASAASKNPSR